MRFKTEIHYLDIYLNKSLIRLCNMLVKVFKIRTKFTLTHCSLVEIWYKENDRHLLWRLKETLPLIDAMQYFIEETRVCNLKGCNHSYILVSLRDEAVIATYKYDGDHCDINFSKQPYKFKSSNAVLSQ